MDAGAEERRRGAYERLGILAWALTALVLVSTFLGGLYRVDGVSMESTLEDGEIMVVCAVGEAPEPGDIVVFRKESFRPAPVVKRVIAVGGQTVEIDYEAGTVTVDGAVLDEPYLRAWMEQQPYQTTVRAVVPEGQLFVMGDNRNASDDSRDPDCGAVDVRLVLGQVALVLWPFRWMG